MMLSNTHHKARGFTLVEVLVALAIMGIVTGLAWQGINAIVQSQKNSQAHSRELAVMQTALAQWEQDLNQLQLLPGSQYTQNVPNLEYKAERQYLRMVRQDNSRADRALRVVAWAKRPDSGDYDAPKGQPGMLLRWQSPAVYTADELEQAWENARRWAEDSEAESLHSYELEIMPLQDWKLLVFNRSSGWAEEASDIAPRGNGSLQLHGLRWVLEPGANSLFFGPIQRDWINPLAPGV